MELRSTGIWSTVASAQTEWITTAIRYLEICAERLPAGDAGAQTPDFVGAEHLANAVGSRAGAIQKGFGADIKRFSR